MQNFTQVCINFFNIKKHFPKTRNQYKNQNTSVEKCANFINKRTTKHLHISNIQFLSFSGESNVPLLEYGENPNLFSGDRKHNRMNK